MRASLPSKSESVLETGKCTVTISHDRFKGVGSIGPQAAHKDVVFVAFDIDRSRHIVQR